MHSVYALTLPNWIIAVSNRSDVRLPMKICFGASVRAKVHGLVRNCHRNHITAILAYPHCFDSSCYQWTVFIRGWATNQETPSQILLFPSAYYLYLGKPQSQLQQQGYDSIHASFRIDERIITLCWTIANSILM